jgi:hypothetical protein
VLWTRSNCEQLVHDQLAAGGFSVFLPTIKTWSRRKDVRRAIALPRFPRSVFVHHNVDKGSSVRSGASLLRLLRDFGDHLPQGWSELKHHDLEVATITVPPCPVTVEFGFSPP